ncbi:MAG: GIY-YIG nuclease family protein [Candidatus Sabulitectum sp.]|nr:GIY-YIG nuclease family protein [Candidatus Sabulitectum sp.]
MIPDRILFVDVQASGNPGNGFLLEVAWKELTFSPHCFLVRNITGMEIPPKVKRITGITNEDVEGSDALHPEELKKLFLAAAGLDEGGPPVTLVAHYAVYEKRWLDWLTGLDLDFLCTRELAMKEIPDLPSGTLRAVAGAVGFSLGEKRRALDHVLATEAVFLAVQSGFSLVSVSREERLSLPRHPGVYRFLDSSGNLLYVGKAKNLRNRVNSHFTGKQKGRHAELVSRTCRILHEEVATALDAAILESQLISELSPQYNLAGRLHEKKLWYIPAGEDKMFTEPGDSSYFGPFSNMHPLAEFLELKAFIETESNKKTFVENLWPEVSESLFKQALAQWKMELGKESIFHHGLRRHLNHDKTERNESAKETELIDVSHVKRKLDSLVTLGCLLCRKAAAHRLLQKCEIRWNSVGSDACVHKFVENSVTDHWSRAKLQTIKVLLSELRRIDGEEKSPEIRTRFGTVLKGKALKYLLSAV